MRRARLLGVGLAVGLAAAGCGPEKEAPTEVRVGTGRAEPAGPAAPKASDPAAKEFVDRVLKAATGGHPDRLDRAKTYDAVFGGMMRLEGAPRGATCRVRAAWPDRFRADYDFPAGDPKQIVAGLRRPQMWILRSGPAGPAPFTPANPAEAADAFFADGVGQHWLPTLAPLADPATVVFDARKQALGGVQAETVKVAVPGCPVYTLWFDATTLRLGVVSYTHAETAGGPPVHKRLTLDRHKEFAGVTLPTRMEYSQNGRTVGEWTAETWNLGAALDDAVFDPPPAGPAKK